MFCVLIWVLVTWGSFPAWPLTSCLELDPESQQPQVGNEVLCLLCKSMEGFHDYVCGQAGIERCSGTRTLGLHGLTHAQWH